MSTLCRSLQSDADNISIGLTCEVLSTGYTSNGQIEINNSATEHALRTVAWADDGPVRRLYFGLLL